MTLKVIYWLFAALFLLGLISATGAALQDTYPTHWRFPAWWAALLGTHLAKLPVVPVIWIAFLFDAFNGFMLLMYAMQPSDGVSVLMLLAPLLILALTVLMAVRGPYALKSSPKGDSNVQL